MSHVFKPEDLLGTKVKHFSRSADQGYNEDEWCGLVVDVSEDNLPLIGVDCGVEFIRYIPYPDLRVCDK